MHEDIVVRVNLDDKYRFLVVTKKDSTIKDLKSEIGNVARLVLSEDVREIISVQNIHEFELPEIYTVGRLLKEHEKVLAYTNSYEPTSKSVDSTNKDYPLSDVSQSCLPKTNEEETNKSCQEILQNVVETVHNDNGSTQDDDDTQEWNIDEENNNKHHHDNKGSPLNAEIELVNDLTLDRHEESVKKVNEPEVIEPEPGNMHCDEGDSNDAHHTNVNSSLQKQTEEHVHLTRECSTKENIGHIDSQEKSEVFENSLSLKRHKKQNQYKHKKRKESRTQSIDDSLAEEELRNRPSDTTSNVSLQSSSISEAVFKSPTFKAILQSKQFRYPRRRQAIEKSVTKVANWLVGSEDNHTESEQTSQIETEIKKDSDKAEQDEHTTSKMYCVVDVKDDKVIYYDSDPSEVSHSGGLLKESNLLSCTMVLPYFCAQREHLITTPSKSVDFCRSKRKCREINEDSNGITENELPATYKSPVFHKNQNQCFSGRLHEAEKDDIEDDKSCCSTEILDHGDDIDRASLKKLAHLTTFNKTLTISPQQTEIQNIHGSSTALHDIVQDQNRSPEDLLDSAKGPIESRRQVKNAQSKQGSNTANVAQFEQSNQNVPNDTIRNEYDSNSSSESTEEKHKLTQSSKNTVPNLSNKQTAESDSDSGSSSSAKEKQKLKQSDKNSVPKQSIRLPKKQTTESDSDSDSSLESAKEKQKLTQSNKISLPKQLTSLSNKEAAEYDSDSDSSLEKTKEKEKLTQTDKIPVPKQLNSLTNKQPAEYDSGSDSSLQSTKEKEKLTQQDKISVPKQLTSLPNKQSVKFDSDSDSSSESVTEKERLTQSNANSVKQTTILSNTAAKESDRVSDSSLESEKENPKAMQHDIVLKQSTLSTTKPKESDNESNSSLESAEEKEKLTQPDKALAKKLDFDSVSTSEIEHSKHSKIKNSQNKVVTVKQIMNSKTLSTAGNDKSSQSDSDYLHTTDSENEKSKVKTTKQGNNSKLLSKKTTKYAPKHSDSSTSDSEDHIKDLPKKLSSTGNKKGSISQPSSNKTTRNASCTNLYSPNEVNKVEKKDTAKNPKKNIPKSTRTTDTKNVNKSKSSLTKNNDSSSLSDSEYLHTTDSEQEKQVSKDVKKPANLSEKNAKTVSKSDSDSSSSDDQQDKKTGKDVSKAKTSTDKEQEPLTTKLPNQPRGGDAKGDSSTSDSEQEDQSRAPSEKAVKVSTSKESEETLVVNVNSLCNSPLRNGKDVKNGNKCDTTLNMMKNNASISETTKTFSQRKANETGVVHTTQKIHIKQSSNVSIEAIEQVAVNQKERIENEHTPSKKRQNLSREDSNEPIPSKKKKMNSKDADNSRTEETVEVENIKKRKKAKDGSSESNINVVFVENAPIEAVEQSNQSTKKRKKTKDSRLETSTDVMEKICAEEENLKQSKRSPKKGKKAKNGGLEAQTSQTSVVEKTSVEEEKTEQANKKRQRKQRKTEIISSEAQKNEVENTATEDKNSEQINKSKRKGKKPKDGSLETLTNVVEEVHTAANNLGHTDKSPKKVKKAEGSNLETNTVAKMCEELGDPEQGSKSPEKKNEANDDREESDNFKEKSKKKKKRKRSSSQENADIFKDNQSEDEEGKAESNNAAQEVQNSYSKKKKKKKKDKKTTEEKKSTTKYPESLEFVSDKRTMANYEGKSKRTNNQCNNEMTHDAMKEISSAELTTGQEDTSKSRKKSKKKKHKNQDSGDLSPSKKSKTHIPEDKVDGCALENITTNTKELQSKSPSLEKKHEKMFSSGSEDDTKHKNINSLLLWIEKKTASPQNKTSKRAKSKLLDLAQDEDDNDKTPSNTNTETPSRSSRSFHRTPTGFTNTLPRMKKTSSRLFFPLTTTRRKRKLSNSLPHSRELTSIEREILSGGVNQLDTLVNEDSFWNS